MRLTSSPWTLEKVIQRGNEIHGDIYNYSLVQKSDINGASSIIEVICNKCNRTWFPTIT